MNTLNASIPFRTDSYEKAIDLHNRMHAAQVILETRGDSTSLRFHDEEWYVIVYTGNIRGMIKHLEEEGFM